MEAGPALALVGFREGEEEGEVAFAAGARAGDSDGEIEFDSDENDDRLARVLGVNLQLADNNAF